MSPVFRRIAILALLQTASSQSCYWPNGQLAVGHAPCFVGNDPQYKGCCDVGDFCTSRGYCFSNSVTFYSRQSCSDASWGSACPTKCIEDRQSQHTNILACNDNTRVRCCAYNGTCCEYETFLMDIGVITALPLQNGQQTSSTAKSTSSTIPSSVPSPASIPSQAPTASQSSGTSATTLSGPGKSDNSSTKIGVSVGVPLDCIALVAVGILLWREKTRNTKTPVTPPAPSQHELDPTATLPSADSWNNMYSQSKPARNHQLAELYQPWQVHEMPPTGEANELPSSRMSRIGGIM